MEQALSRISANKAAGSDMFPGPLMLKDEYSTKAFEMSLEILNRKRYPLIYYAKARLLLLSKTNNLCVSPENTRPISILSILWKLIEAQYYQSMKANYGNILIKFR